MTTNTQHERRDSSAIDSVVVGGGIAGLSAALFLVRAGRSTIVFDAGRPRIRAVDRVREFVGFDGWTPDEMLARAREEVLRYGGRIHRMTVERIEPRTDGWFNVWTSEGVTVSKTIVLATGLVDELPPLEGLRDVWGRDLHICPCFDGHELRNQRFVVFGLAERLAQFGSWVSMWSSQVMVVTPLPLDVAGVDRLRLLNIRVVHDNVTGLIHQGDRLVALATESGVNMPCDAAWIATPLRAASPLAASLCEVDEGGFAKTDAHGRTSRSGVFAIGNAANPVAHLAHAAAAGTEVGPWVTMHLLESSLQRSSLPDPSLLEAPLDPM
jgi:thioredoxin reductase